MPTNDAIAVLKADHAAVKELFAKYDGLGEGATKTKQETARKICQELTIHAAIEEELFYPRVRRAGEEEKDEVLEGVEEHAIVKKLVSEIESLTPDDETFDAKVKVLKENVEHHVEEEETVMFPHVRKAVPEAELTELGEKLTAAKQEHLAAR
jgi:hemerythrin superfamily protein